MTSSLNDVIATNRLSTAVLPAREVPARVIDPGPIADQLVSFVAPGSYAADQYRALRHLVERMRIESQVQVFAVTSPTPGDGKTITTLNLAGALGQAPETRVLLIDADLRRASVSEYLALTPGTGGGLVDAIKDPACGLEQVVRRLEGLNLSVLPAGPAENGTYELLNSPRFEAIVAETRRLYDYVVVDTAPLVPVPDCRLIGRIVDGFLVVVAAHKTPRRMLAEGLNLLDPAKVLGTVFNFDDPSPSGCNGYYGYYGYGHEGQKRRGRWWLSLFGRERGARR